MQFETRPKPHLTYETPQEIEAHNLIVEGLYEAIKTGKYEVEGGRFSRLTTRLRAYNLRVLGQELLEDDSDDSQESNLDFPAIKMVYGERDLRLIKDGARLLLSQETSSTAQVIDPKLRPIVKEIDDTLTQWKPEKLAA